jgi:CubicO group peptidase (beta-lactamase class C family)
MMTTVRRRALKAVGALVLLAALLLAVACIVYPPQYVWRVLVWQDADADDWQRFAMRRMAPAAGAQPLPRRPDPASVTAAWVTAGGQREMEAELASHGTQAFLVLRDGVVIHESYANGGSREGWVTSFSVAKSFLSALLGVAVAEGRIDTLDAPVTRWVPELLRRDPRFAQVTLRHLVNMASGLHYAEFPFLHGDDAKTYYHPDLRALALFQSRVETPPGQRFHYNNYHPLLLGIVIERATGMPVADYLAQKLWQPAGMVGEASWSLDREGGFEKMESGINARAEDFARFGLLMLHQGRVGDRAVVPADWAQASTSPLQAPADYYAGSPWHRANPARFYTAMWWGQARPEGGRDFAARGNHGQMVFVSPRNGVVIVRHGWRYGLPPQVWFERARVMADALGSGR